MDVEGIVPSTALDPTSRSGSEAHVEN